MLIYISNNILLCLIFTSNFLLLFILCFFLILVISKIHVLFGLKMNEDDVCLADCVTTYNFLR